MYCFQPGRSGLYVYEPSDAFIIISCVVPVFLATLFMEPTRSVIKLLFISEISTVFSVPFATLYCFMVFSDAASFTAIVFLVALSASLIAFSLALSAIVVCALVFASIWSSAF